MTISPPWNDTVSYHTGMPSVFFYKGLRFYFFSNEGTPREPIHIHVEGEGGNAKVWLDPGPVVAYNRGFNAATLREIVRVVSFRRNEIEKVWDDFFTGES